MTGYQHQQQHRSAPPSRRPGQASARPGRRPTGGLLDLQAQVGNRAATHLVSLLGTGLVAAGGSPTPTRQPGRGPVTDDGGAPGARLDHRDRSFFEDRLRVDLAGVRVHTGSDAGQAADALSARAFTVGRHIVFGSGEYRPDTHVGRALLAHELTHVVQQGGEPTAIQCEDRTGGGAPSGTVLEQYAPGLGRPYRAGDTAASSVLMRIESRPRGGARFYWFNFTRGQPQEGSREDWDQRVAAAYIGMNSDDFAGVGRALTPAQWAALWPDPRAKLLELNEQGKLSLPDATVLEAYHGLLHTQALQTLDENEKAVDTLLAVPDRLAFFQRYADGLREASLVRDALETRKRDLGRSSVQMQGFSFGMAGRVTGMNPARRLDLMREATTVDQTLAFWMGAFPLLSRLRTDEIRPTSVVSTLQTIKQNIVSTRAQLALGVRGHGSLELWDLDNMRAKVNSTLGTKARAVVADEEKSRRRWGWVKAGAAVAVGVALLFVPGGAFVDLAIGAAMGLEAIDRARVVGRAANTGIDVDAGLVSRAAASAAAFEAVLATVFAVLGAAGVSLRVLRVSRLLGRVRAAAPGLELASQVRVARLLAGNKAWLRAGADLGELNRAVVQAAEGLRFEEVRALRAVVYQAQGAALPAHSAESLAELLQKVWAGREQILARGNSSAVYKIYSQAGEANVLTKQPTQYLHEVADIARSRPAGAVSNIQGGGGPEILDLVAAQQFSGRAIEKTFYRFVRAGARVREEVGERIYLNVGADHATEVMNTVVREIIDNPAAFPGARMAKLAGPASVSGRAESIVVYVTDAAEAGRVVTRMRALQAANPGRFKSGTPYLSEKVLEGVSLGSEPLAARGGASFGQVRSEAIFKALQQTVSRGEGLERFAAAAAEQLRRMGVNPAAPHLNLPTP